MPKNVVIIKRVILQPTQLSSSNLEEKLLTLIAKSKEDHLEEYGHILKINKLLEYTNSISNDNGAIVFITRILADTLKPKEGDLLEATIDKMNKTGIFLNIEKKIIIFVVLDSILALGWTWNAGKECYSKVSKGKEKDGVHVTNLAIGDTLKVKIGGVKFDKQYYCFGRLVESEDNDD
jgi:DNA-directed RNA polymerase subunit E'/Rpb7